MLTLWSIIKNRMRPDLTCFCPMSGLRRFKDGLCNRTNTPVWENVVVRQLRSYNFSGHDKKKKKNEPRKTFLQKMRKGGEAAVASNFKWCWRLEESLLLFSIILNASDVKWQNASHKKENILSKSGLFLVLEPFNLIPSTNSFPRYSVS